MLIVLLGLSTLVAVFGAYAAYVSSASLLIAAAAYVGCGFVTMTTALLVAFLSDHLSSRADAEAPLYPAE